MATIYELAQMSSNVYGSTSELLKNLSGWQVLETSIVRIDGASAGDRGYCRE